MMQFSIPKNDKSSKNKWSVFHLNNYKHVYERKGYTCTHGRAGVAFFSLLLGLYIALVTVIFLDKGKRRRERVVKHTTSNPMYLLFPAMLFAIKTCSPAIVTSRILRASSQW